MSVDSDFDNRMAAGELMDGVIAMVAPEPKDLSHHLSRTTKLREGSKIKQFYKYFAIPGIGQLAGGLPNDHYFPYDTLEAKAALPDRWRPTPNDPVDPPTERLSQTSISKQKRDSEQPNRPETKEESKVVVPHTSTTPNPLRKIDLDSALQYGQAQGYPPLYAFIRQFVRENLHPNVPYAGGPEVILTCGATDGLNKAIQALNNEWHEGHDPVSDREGLLCEEYAFMNAIQGVKPRGLNIVPVGIDDEGMRASGPGGLREVLENWDEKRGKIPHLMYTVTVGQNPTSGTLSVERRKEIYELAVKYDIIIIEDDPYWYLQFPSSNTSDTKPVPKPAKSSGFDFLDSLVPSYLSVDYEGRVVRLDTFSKTIAPGCRLGWITAQPKLVERILRITETSTQQPSGFVQSMIAELIVGPARGGDGEGQGGAEDGKGWEVGGWVRWIEGLRGEYERRMNDMCDILDQGQHIVKAGRRPSITALNRPHDDNDDDEERDEEGSADDWSVIEKTRVYRFVRPLGGMFIWIRFHFDTHPLFNKGFSGPELSKALWVFWTTKKYRVLVSPGTMFAPTQEIAERDAWECYRLCFAAIEKSQLEPVSWRLVNGVKAFWRIKDKGTIQKLIDEADDDDAGAAAFGEDVGSLCGLGC